MACLLLLGLRTAVFMAERTTLKALRGPAFLVPLGSTFGFIQVGPSMAIDADGDFVIGWQERSLSQSQGLYFQKYSALGATEGNVVAVGGGFEISVAMETTGKIFTAYTDSANVWAKRFSSAGGELGQSILVATNTIPGVSRIRSDTHISANGNGAFVVSWTQFANSSVPDLSRRSGDVAARSFSSNGAPLSSEVLVGQTVVENQTDSSIGMDSQGNFIVVWRSELQDGDQGGIYAHRFTPSAVPLGPEFRVNTNRLQHQRAPSIAVQGPERFVVVWVTDNRDQTQMAMQRYVSLVNSAPTAIAATEDRVIDSVSPGTLVGYLVAADANPEDGHTFQLIDSAGGRFRVSGNRLEVAPGAQLNYAFAHSYTVVIRSTDQLGAVNSTGNNNSPC